MKEQRDQLRKETSLSRMTRKKTKFHLGDESDDDDNFNFLTHKGKKIEELDDFKDKISDDSDDYEDMDLAKGIMNDEMVKSLNFGGGETQEGEIQKKSREERHAEIVEKSKAYKLHHQEIKEANQEYTRQLDEEWNDVAALLTFKGRDIDRPAPATQTDT